MAQQQMQQAAVVELATPSILGASHLRAAKVARKLAAISLVAAGYAGDMDDELANELTSLTSVATRQILS